MRIVSYNILDGGEGRADPLAEVIEAQHPDIVALIEAQELSVVERIARRLNMDYVVGAGTSGKASTILSRYPIRDSINHAVLRPAEIPKSFLEVTLQTPEFGDLPVGVLHLTAGAFEADERAREDEIASILKLFSRHRNPARPHLLVGDFNANSPLQQIDLERCKEKTKKAWQANGGNLPRRVVPSLFDIGYTDTLQAFNSRAAERLTTFTTKDPGQRVDYIFSFGIEPRRIQRAWVETDRLATYASDHYPICAEIT
ncbi:MAG TPA: endonuclease/exonuclease/phosphatase family protein [Tepidisphaeraceae bacterium]|jgi:endonuclease/exonuclease/phosphatase family metal-dependent hydrolase|nr:endonuclease/exonuclease/phosphatase family protein [Tepidisphaeraceae bacterium]